MSKKIEDHVTAERAKDRVKRGQLGKKTTLQQKKKSNGGGGCTKCN